MRLLAVAVATLVLAPVVTALVAELSNAGQHPFPTSDPAVLELHTAHAALGDHLLGPYSQYFWNHPGPLYYYLLAPAYFVSGRATESLYLTATLINLLALGGALWIHFREERRPLGRLALAALLLAFLADFTGQHQPAALTSIWNPLVTVLPFGAFVLLAATVASGRDAALPALVLVHAFVTQTHVAYGPTATALLVAALALRAHRRRRRGPSAGSGGGPRRWPLWAGLLGLVAWLPPLWVELGSAPSNAAALATHFARGDSLVFGWREGVVYAAHQFGAPLLRALRAAGGAAIAGQVALLLYLVQLALLGLAAHRARARGATYPAALATLVLLGALVATWSCRYVGDIGGRLHGYLTHWLALLSALGWTAILSALLPPAALRAGRRAPSSRRLRSRPAVWWFGAVTAFLSISSVFVVLRGYAAEGEAAPPEPTAAASIVGQWRGWAGQEDALQHPVLRLEEHHAWRVLAGVVLALDKEGVEPVLERRFRFIFGGGLAYAELGAEDSLGLYFSLRQRHDKPLFALHEPARLYAPPRSMRSARLPATAVLAATADGMAAGVAPVHDGFVPTDGTAARSGNAAVWTTPTGAIRLRLAQLLIDEVVISASGDDAYLLEGSADGRAFVPLGIVPAMAEAGLQQRVVQPSSRGPFAALRLRVESGAAPFAVAEIDPRPLAWAARVVAAVGAERPPELATDGAIPPAGSPWDAPGAVVMAPGSSLTLALPPLPPSRGYVGGVRLTADCNDRYRIEGSRDGRRFQAIETATAVRGWGLQPREVYFNDLTAWSHLRLAPRGGDGSFSVAEVELLTTDAVLVDLGTTAARALLGAGWSGDEQTDREMWVWAVGTQASLAVDLVPGTPYDLALTVAPVRREGRRQRLSVAINGVAVAAVTLHPGVRTHHVLVPAGAVEPSNQLDFSFAFAAKPTDDDPRPLAVRFDRILLRPLDGIGDWLVARR